MSTAGYSGTPMPRKLGIKEGSSYALVNPPPDFNERLAPLPPGAQLRTLRSSGLDVIVFFSRDRAVVEDRFSTIAAKLAPSGGLWIGWPKRTSGLPTDLDENVVRAIGLASGLVDNKVAALDEIWSGLRFVVRLENREQWPPAGG